MAFVKVYSLGKLPPDSVTEVMVGGTLMALCNVGGEVRAVGGVCPHEGGPLGMGAMHDEKVVCPWHAWEFNTRTGELDCGWNTFVPVYPVRIEGDDILVDPGA
jgi:nitrite reductase (NADH) small subunit